MFTVQRFLKLYVCTRVMWQITKQYFDLVVVFVLQISLFQFLIFFWGIIWPVCLLPTTLAISYSHIFWCIDGCSHNGIWKCKNSLLLLLFSPTFLGLVCLEAFFCKAWNQRKCLAFCQCLPHAISCDGNSVLSNSFNSVTLSKIINSGKFRNKNL